MDERTIRDILASGHFDQLKGKIELQTVECKSVAYRLEQGYQKQELAKDVSGMANAAGGFILLGVGTEIDPNRAEERISQISPFSHDRFDPQQYRDVLKVWVYPFLENLELEWWPCAEDQNKGIAAIYIPLQPSNKHPFLVTRAVNESGKAQEIVFGHFERRRTSVDAMSVARLHSTIQAGLQAHAIMPQLASMQEILEQLVARAEMVTPLPVHEISEEETRQRIDQALAASDLNDKPAYGLSVRPVAPSRYRLFSVRGEPRSCNRWRTHPRRAAADSTLKRLTPSRALSKGTEGGRSSPVCSS